MHFALIISVVALTIGSQAAPQFTNFNLGDIIEGARNQVRNAISHMRTPFQRNDYLHRSNSPFGQPYRSNNNHDRQMSQADQELWTQCTNLFAAHPQRAWQNQNPSSTFHSFPMGQSGVDHPDQRPLGDFSGGWEVQQPHAPLQQQFQERPRQPPPPDHRPGHMSPPRGPHHNHHHRPGQPSHGPENCQPNGGGCGPGIGEHVTTAASVSTAELVADPSTSPSITNKAIGQDNGNAATVTSRVVENSVTSTTEFDWNSFYVGASPDNTGGAGSIDVRGDFK